MHFWPRFRADDLIEFRCIRGRAVKRYWLCPSQISGMAVLLATLNAGGYEIYAGVNPRRPNGSGREDVTTVVSLHVDCDGPLSIPADVPEPSLIVASGAGHHLYWLIEPSTDFALCEAANRGLARLVGGDSHCSDVSRVLRVPGYRSWKRGAEVEIIRASEQHYQIENFRQFTDAAKSAGAAAPKSAQNELVPGAELTARLAAVRKKDRSLSRAWWGDVGDGASDARYAVVCRLRASGQFADDEIVALVRGRRWYNRRTGRVTAPQKAEQDAISILCSFRGGAPANTQTCCEVQ